MENSELTTEEKEILAELDEIGIIETVGRKAEGYTDETRKRTELLKGLVYKDLINFSIEQGFYGYKFYSRNLVDGKRF